MGHKDYQSGFSLLELMTAIVILVILATVAVPSFSALVEQTRQEIAAEQLRTHLALARIESVTRQEWVTICRSNDQQTCVGDVLTGAIEWSGLFMFVDHDRNRLPTKPEDVIRVTTVNYSPLKRVSFQASDLSRSLFFFDASLATANRAFGSTSLTHASTSSI